MVSTGGAGSAARARFLTGAAILALTLVYIAHVFRVPDGDPFRAGIGDWIDPYFINYLLEHWRVSLAHFTNPASPPMFFPESGTLGYSHALILYVPFYLVARMLTSQPLIAHNVALMLVFATGIVTLYMLLRQAGRLGAIEALALSALFATSGNIVNHQTAAWSQRASVFLLPPIALAIHLAMRGQGTQWSVVLACLGGLAAGLVPVQDFQTGAFTLLVLISGFVFVSIAYLVRTRDAAGPSPLRVLLAMASGARDEASAPPSRAWLVVAAASAAVALAIAIHPIERTELGPIRFSANNASRPAWIATLAVLWYVARRWRADRIARSTWTAIRSLAVWRTHGRRLASLAAGVLTGAAVFLYVYLDTYLHKSEFPRDQLMNSLTTFGRPTGLSASEAIRSIVAYPSARTMVWALIGLIATWIPGARADRRARISSAWLAGLTLLVIAIPVQWAGFSPWLTFFAWVPGLSAIRDPARIIQVYELAAVLVMAWAIASLPRRSAGRVVPIAAALLLLVTAWNPERFSFDRPVDVYEKWVDAPITVAPSCQSFFIKGASAAYMSRSGHMWSLYAGDAIFISLAHGLPTLNGYSAWTPDEWHLANPQEPGYADAVRHWIDRHQLRGVCELDIEARTMTPRP